MNAFKNLQTVLARLLTSLTCLAAAAALLISAPAPGDTIIDDPFTDGGVSNGADPLDSSWGGSGSSTRTVADDPVIGDDNAMFIDTSSTFSNTTTSFTAITLDPGVRDKLRVEFDLHITESPVPTQSDGFRFGLRNSSAGTQYHARYNTTATDGTATGAILAKNGDGTFGGGGQIDLISSDPNASSLNDNNRHYARFTVQYTSAGRVDVRGRIDTQVIAAADTGAGPASINTTFNQAGFQNGGAVMDYAIDNYRITRWRGVLDDTFDVGATPTTGNDGDDPNDGAWGTFGTGASISIVSDDNVSAGEIGSNNALLLTTGGTFNKARTTFAKQALGVGNTLSASFDFRLLDVENATGGFRFGLYNDGNHQQSDTGYFVSMGTGTSNGLSFTEDPTTGGDFLGGGGTLGLGGTGASILDESVAHLAELLLKRVDTDTVLIEFFLDGRLIHSVTDTSAINNNTLNTVFGAFGVSSGNSANDIVIDNVVIDFMIPTPAALPTGLILIGGLAMRRRR